MYKKCEQILKELENKNEIKVKWDFEFPEKQELKLKLRDILENEVDEKYYLSDKQIERIKTTTYNVGKTRIQEKDYSDTLCARDYKDPKCVKIIADLDNKGWQDHMNRVYSKSGISPTISTYQGGNTQPKIVVPQNLKSKCKRLASLVEKTTFEEGKVLNMDLYNQTVNQNISQTLTEPNHNTQRLFDGHRIRKLTPKECWRLMGFKDEEFEKAQQVNSNSQLYKQAGNSIVVNVLEEILRNLFLESNSEQNKQ